MLDRPVAAGSRPSADGTAPRRRWPWAFVAAAGLMGAAGVGLGAAAAHLGGGSDLVRTASEFLLIHAAAVVATSALASSMPRIPRALPAAMALLVLGSVSFAAELAAAGLWDLRPVPLAAPIGGFGMIAGWLLLSVAAASVTRTGR